jgi:hypothetical protein
VKAEDIRICMKGVEKWILGGKRARENNRRG